MGEVPLSHAVRAIALVEAEGTDKGSRVGVEIEVAVSDFVSGRDSLQRQKRKMRAYLLQQDSQNEALHSGLVFRHLIFSFSDFRRH
jgi:hypothetical protein